MRLRSGFMFLSINIQLLQHHMLKSSFEVLLLLCQKSVWWICLGSLWSIDLCVCPSANWCNLYYCTYMVSFKIKQTANPELSIYSPTTGPLGCCVLVLWLKRGGFSWSVFGLWSISVGITRCWLLQHTIWDIWWKKKMQGIHHQVVFRSWCPQLFSLLEFSAFQS